MADASVVAVMVGQAEPASVRTDKKGEWRIKNLAEGQWRLEIAKEGLETNKQVVEIRNDKVPPVNVTLSKEVAKADPTVEINAAVAKAAELAQAGRFRKLGKSTRTCSRSTRPCTSSKV